MRLYRFIGQRLLQYLKHFFFFLLMLQPAIYAQKLRGQTPEQQ